MTIRTKAELTALFADNTTGAISPQDLRDFLDSIMGVYGDIGIITGGTAQSFSSGVPEIMTGWEENGASSGVTAAFGSGSITIDYDGDYRVDFYCSFQGNNPIVNEFMLYKNGVDTGIHVDRKTTSTDVGSAGFTRITSLVAGDVLTIWFVGDGTSSFTPKHAGFGVERLG